MITRSFPRQRLGESVWVPNPVQGMAFFGFLKLFACWYGSKQNKLPSKIQWINMWQDSSLEDIQSIEKTKLHRSWKSISPITPILQSQTFTGINHVTWPSRVAKKERTPFPWILTAPCWHPSSFEIFPKLVDFFPPSSVLHSPLCLNLRLGAPDGTKRRHQRCVIYLT